MLHVSLVMAGLLGATPYSSSSEPAASPVQEERTSVTEKRTVVALRRAYSEASRRAASDDVVTSEVATGDLAKLYAEVMQSPHLPQREQERLRIQIRTRLMQLSRDIEQRLAREENDAAKVERVNGIHAQQFGAQRPGAAGAFGMQQPQNAAQGPAHRGQELVDLIQRTIAPESWDINGGVGTIVYWPNFQALIVRQRGEVHGDLGGLLNGLRGN